MKTQKRRPKHHSVIPGAKVEMKLVAGDRFITKYRRNTDNKKGVVTDAGTFRWRKIEIFRIVKGVTL